MAVLDDRMIVQALVQALSSSSWVLAIWEGGSMARGRRDAHSDIDLSIVVQDMEVERGLDLIAHTLESLGRIDRTMRIPEPTWHGHSQCFYHLEGTPETLLIDCAVMKQSAPDHFLAPEQHGNPLVHLDPHDIVRPPEFDADALRAELWRVYHGLVARFEMFQDVLVPKELARGNVIDALQFYQGFTLRPLLHMLGIAHRPLRHNFNRYAHQELPPHIITRLAPLYLVSNADELALKHAHAVAFFWEVTHALDIDTLDLDGDSLKARQKPL